MTSSTSSVTSSILTALGGSSQIDTTSLVASLVSATRQPKEAAITSRQSLNTARVSAIASATSSLDTFADALKSLLSGSGYSGTPTSNNISVANVSALPGGTPAGLPAQLEVKQLAASRTLASTPVSGATASSPVGLGKLSLTVAGVSQDIEITSANNSYSGLAAAINAANLGATASVVTDTQGTRLVVKGPTGAANDISLTNVSADADLAKFAWSGTDSATMASMSDPKDSIIVLDGVEQHYAGNTIDKAISYLRIDLSSAEPGTLVTLSTSQPTTSMRDLMVEYVDAYNTLMKALNTATATGTDQSNSGVLNGDPAIRDMKRQLSALNSTAMSSTGTYRTLSSLGIATNRDGTLTLDTKQLDAAIAADPAAITQMLNPAVSSATTPGLAGLMGNVRDAIEQKDGALAQSKAKYDALAASFTDQLAKLDDQMSNYQEQLTNVYASMNTRLSTLKATQSYLTQQIAVWNNSNNN